MKKRYQVCKSCKEEKHFDDYKYKATVSKTSEYCKNCRTEIKICSCCAEPKLLKNYYLCRGSFQSQCKRCVINNN